MPDEPEAPSKPGFKANFTKKVGPLPVWAWGIGGAAVLYLGYRWFKARASAAAAPATSGTTPTDLGAGTSSTPGSNGYQDVPGLGTLQQQLQAIQQQLGQGTSAGSTVTTPGALTNYRLLTPSEWQANLGNIYQELTPGIFTKYTGAVSLLKSPGFIPEPSANVSGAAAPSSTAAPAPVTMGPTAPAMPAGSSLGGVAGVGGSGPSPAIPQQGAPYGGAAVATSTPVHMGPTIPAVA